jgi:hypothetical protein
MPFGLPAPAAQLVLIIPIALPLLGSFVAATLGPRNGGVARIAVSAGAWAAAVAALAIWLPVRSTQELALGQLGFGSTLELRLDTIGLFFALVILVPVAALLTLQPRTWQESTVAGLGVAAAVLAVEGGGVLITAIAGCTAATLAVVQLDIEDARGPRPSWALMFAAWLALAWAGVILQVAGGTAVYSAVPVSAMTLPVFVLIAFAAVFGGGLLPWRGWASRIWSRTSLRAAGLTVAILQPLALYLFIRAYELGNGGYPQSWLNVALAAWGVLVAFGAAARAQAATTRREYMAEVLPALAGFAVMAVAVGSVLGLVAGLVLVASTAAIAICLPLLPDRGGPPALLVSAAAAGIPPSLVFGGLLLGLGSAIEEGGAMGLIGLAGVATWLVWAAAAARSVALPAGHGRASAETFPRVALVVGASAIAAGPALGLVYLAATFGAGDVMPNVYFNLQGGVDVVTVSTVLPVVTLFGPMLVIAAIAVALSRPAPPVSRAQTLPPLFPLFAAAQWARAAAVFRQAAVPSDYRSLFNPRALEQVAASGTPLLWLASIVALVVAVTR